MKSSTLALSMLIVAALFLGSRQRAWAQTAGTAASKPAPTSGPAASKPAPTSGPAASQPAQAVTTATETVAEANAPLDPTEAAIQKIKNPVPWLKWGADMRAREEYFNNATTLNQNSPNHEWNFQRYRERVWTTVIPVENIEFNTRVMWEPRHYCEPESKPDWVTKEAMFDIFNVTFKKIAQQDWTVVAGRQEMMFGDGWLIMDGTGEDGSRTIFFDAVRSTYNLQPAKTTVDLVYIDQGAGEGRYCAPFNDNHTPLSSQDERGVIAYARNKSIDATTLDGYYIWKEENIGERWVGIKPDSAELHTFGTRVEHDFDDHWRARGEIAGQLGTKNEHEVEAMAANSRLAYAFNDKLRNELRTGYEFLSGDDPSTGKIESFDILWGRWARFSEIYPFIMVPETRIADYTNMHRFNVIGWTIKPTSPMEICLDYHLLWAVENTYRNNPNFSSDGLFRGQLFTALWKYKFNEHVSTHVVGEIFAPGDYYTARTNDVAVYARWEVMLTW